MMILTRLSAITFAAAAIAACSATGISGPPSASDYAGDWTRLGEVPGSNEHWTLTLSDTVVTGTGTWAGEACCAGNLVAHGYVSRNSLHLDVDFYTGAATNVAPRFSEHVDAALQSTDDIVGTATVNGFASDLHMRRGTSTF